MKDEEPLPLSRMATINKPSFWIFILACLCLYVANKMIAPNTLNITFLLIIGAAFTGLLLNILTISLTNKVVTRALTMICYIFEAISIVVLCFLVFSR
jgi:FtsH-binding integral membrane protein